VRTFFNHGLLPSEIYTNTPKKIIDRKWTWLISKFGSSSSYEDAIADPFKYCFGLILNRVIDDKVRFKIPYAEDAYIDFEIVLGDKFENHRQNGRFSEIDFIESDFTGYCIRYYFKSKAYQKSYPIHIGGDLKKKFLSKINSGEKFNTIKDLTINDFIDEVHTKFNSLTKKEVRDLLIQAFRRMHSSIKYGCAITINTTKFINCYAFIGNLSQVPEKQIQQYSRKMAKKLRKIEMWKRLDFDGYYYIGLTESVLEKWANINKNNRVKTHFTHIMVRKIKEEIFYKNKHVYIFRIPVKKFKGYCFWAEELVTRELEYLGESYEYNFIPSNKTWKEIIKEYGTTSS